MQRKCKIYYLLSLSYMNLKYLSFEAQISKIRNKLINLLELSTFFINYQTFSVMIKKLIDFR